MAVIIEFEPIEFQCIGANSIEFQIEKYNHFEQICKEEKLPICFYWTNHLAISLGIMQRYRCTVQHQQKCRSCLISSEFVQIDYDLHFKIQFVLVYIMSFHFFWTNYHKLHIFCFENYFRYFFMHGIQLFSTLLFVDKISIGQIRDVNSLVNESKQTLFTLLCGHNSWLVNSFVWFKWISQRCPIFIVYCDSNILSDQQFAFRLLIFCSYLDLKIIIV